MRSRNAFLVVAALVAAFTTQHSARAQTSVLLSLKMSTNGLTNWQTVHTVATNLPVSPQAFYRMDIVLTNGTQPPTNMALIPEGSFQMGNALSASGDGEADELPVHTVHVSAFYMDKHEVTKALWDEVATWAAANGYDISAASASGKAANHPVYFVTWYEAVKWSNARSQKEGLTPCYTVGGAVMKTGASTPDCNFAANGYRLPTEAEWEKAARGGLSGKRFPWGDTISHSQANYRSFSYFDYDLGPTDGYHPNYNDGVEPYSSPAGSFAPNTYDLYDMCGNVGEWCWDYGDSGYYASSPSSDPRGPSFGDRRVTRGSGWWDEVHRCRTASRNDRPPSYSSSFEGFRCVRSSVP